MAHRCDFCGDILDEDELERSERIGKDVCHDCLHHGMTLLQKVLADVKREQPASEEDRERTMEETGRED